MKIEDAKYVGFKPFKMVLTVESMSELVLLWMRLNASTSSILEANKEASESIIKHYDPYAEDPTQQIWEYLDDRVNCFLDLKQEEAWHVCECGGRPPRRSKDE